MAGTQVKKLSDAIDVYLEHRKVAGMAPATIRSNVTVLQLLLSTVGNIPTKNLDGHHVAMYFAAASRTRRPSTLNKDHFILKTFFTWLRHVGALPLHGDPLAGFRTRRVQKRDRLRIPATDFPGLLDHAEHPRDRMVLALGMYLFLRSSEIATIKIDDVDLVDGEVAVWVHKTGQFDRMPISSELDREIRRWLTWYTTTCGAPKGSWYLIPAKKSPRMAPNDRGRYYPQAGPGLGVIPTRRAASLEHVVQKALTSAGYTITGEDGKPTREGIHTLRRSGARALFDEMTSAGYDGAMREVMAMLHHSSQQTTEIYLGLSIDRKKRDDRIKGRLLFPSAVPAGNVVNLRGEASG